MSELDRIKEQLAYVKFWQGILVVADISLAGLPPPPILPAPGHLRLLCLA